MPKTSSAQRTGRPPLRILHPVSLVLGLAWCFALGLALRAEAWTPPVGIPVPPFGITEVAPAVPSPWTVPTPGFYSVNTTATNATDLNNPYGTPARPRQTIPLTLPAGSVVEVHGVYYRSLWSGQPTGHTSPYGFTANGTAAAPVFIRGASPANKPKIVAPWEVKGTYLILENLEFADYDGDLAGGSTGALDILAPASFVALRNSDLHGNLQGGGLAIASFLPPFTVSNVVIYGNLIHDNGDVNATFDQDVHGITVNARVSNLWVVDNTLYRNSGDGIQINAGSLANQPTVHHIYVGRNLAYSNKQTGFWVKQAVDVIFSQNVAHDHRPGNSSMGQCMGFQYGPERVWFLYNEVYNCEFGIMAGSNGGLGSGQNQYAIGNLIHDIRSATSYNPDTAWSQAGIMWAGGTNRYFINNTIWNADAGINVPGGGTVAIVNNIIGPPLQAQGKHIFLEAPLAALNIQNDLFQGNFRVRLWNGSYTSLGGLQAAGQGLNSLNADPQFVAPGNYHLSGTSPAIDRGVAHGVYQTFFELYGLSIAVDRDGVPRPQGVAWDMGAYEYTSGGSGDTVPPVVAITLVDLQRNVLTVSVSATDNVGVTRVDMYLDGVRVLTLTTAPYVFNGNISALPAGTHTLQARGYDAVGNVGVSTPVSFTK